jgi:hypothetical protein
MKNYIKDFKLKKLMQIYCMILKNAIGYFTLISKPTILYMISSIFNAYCLLSRCQKTVRSFRAPGSGMK